MRVGGSIHRVTLPGGLLITIVDLNFVLSSFKSHSSLSCVRTELRNLPSSERSSSPSVCRNVEKLSRCINLLPTVASPVVPECHEPDHCQHHEDCVTWRQPNSRESRVREGAQQARRSRAGRPRGYHVPAKSIHIADHRERAFGVTYDLQRPQHQPRQNCRSFPHTTREVDLECLCAGFTAFVATSTRLKAL